MVLVVALGQIGVCLFLAGFLHWTQVQSANARPQYDPTAKTGSASFSVKGGKHYKVSMNPVIWDTQGLTPESYEQITHDMRVTATFVSTGELPFSIQDLGIEGRSGRTRQVVEFTPPRDGRIEITVDVPGAAQEDLVEIEMEATSKLSGLTPALSGGFFLALVALGILAIPKPSVQAGLRVGIALVLPAIFSGVGFFWGSSFLMGFDEADSAFPTVTATAILEGLPLMAILAGVAWIAGWVTLLMLARSTRSAAIFVCGSVIVVGGAIWAANWIVAAGMLDSFGAVMFGVPFLVLAGLALFGLGAIGGGLIRLGEGASAGPKTDLDVEPG